jgi:hypothetical protein
MKIRIPPRLAAYWDRTCDFIAYCLFPPPKPTGYKIAGYKITLTDLAVVAYTLAIGIGLALYFHNWLWLIATIGSMTFAAMLFAWFF